MIAIRRARPGDAPGIGAVHVASWRATYPGVLPDEYLAGMSVQRQSGHYDRAIRLGIGVHVATVSGSDQAPQVIGFCSANRNRRSGLADGEIETLYVLDDYRERGVGRQLLRCAASYLAASGCKSVCLWVLRDNPAAFFYERMGGRKLAHSVTRVAGVEIPQTAYGWDPIELLL